jgi:hypothetical protein
MRQNRRRLRCRLGSHRWKADEIDGEPVTICRDCGEHKGGDDPDLDVRGKYGFG